MAQELDPEQIQAPGFVEEDGHDLPISPARPPIHDRLQAVLDAAPLGPGHALVRNRIRESDRLSPIPPYPGPDYRPEPVAATLMALFNVSPFLNFLEDVAKKNASHDPLLAGLHALARSFRGWRGLAEDEKKQQEEIASLWGIIWNIMNTNRPVPARSELPQKLDGGPAFREAEFISYLFRTIEHGDLQLYQAGGDV